MRIRSTEHIAVATLLLVTAALRAQYPGHVDTSKKDAATTALRSIGVLEWTGDRSRPSATRVVPVSLFDGTHLQEGGLYLARPVPLALDSGTEYEVESAGLPQGWFDLNGARQIGDRWFGFGTWKPYLPPAPKKLHPSRNPVTVVQEKPADDRPHFKRREDAPAAPAQGAPDQTTAAGSKQASPQQAPSEPADPDRPRLRRRPAEDAPAAPAAAPETPSSTPDADRPRLAHGVPNDLKNEPQPLETTPVALGQAVAVSDAERTGHQTFAYDWSSPADAEGARTELESQAERLLRAASPALAAAAETVPPARVHPASQKTRRRHTARPSSSAAATPQLDDVLFHAFALTYGGGATLVMTAREPGSTRSIALVALQDIYGKVQVIWSSITDDAHLDITPRTTLVDAVDPRGDGRADLLFEQRNATDRRFVLYAVGANTAEPIFATDPLPLHPVAQPAE